jgi:hypothetical protein
VVAKLTMISASHDLQPLSLRVVVEIVIDSSITFPELSSCGVECILKRCIAHVHVYSLVLFTQNIEEGISIFQTRYLKIIVGTTQKFTVLAPESG